jgi:hypothetical protein
MAHRSPPVPRSQGGFHAITKSAFGRLLGLEHRGPTRRRHDDDPSGAGSGRRRRVVGRRGRCGRACYHRNPRERPGLRGFAHLVSRPFPPRCNLTGDTTRPFPIAASRCQRRMIRWTARRLLCACPSPVPWAWRDRRQLIVETADEPYYAELEDVYHVIEDCPLGRRIPAELRQVGTGGRALCPACEVRQEARRRLDI